jgi:hypothetical protein
VTAIVVERMPDTEAAIVAAIVANLGDLGTVQAYGEEIPSHGRSRADVAALVGNDLVLIEAKRTAWQRAISQAAMNRLCCDRSYSALWSGRATPAVLAEASRLGVGVLTVHDGALEVALEAEPREPNAAVRGAIIERIRGTSG